MNTNSHGVLRSWPTIDSWQVALVRTDDNRLACMTVTGQKSDSILQYFFGLDEDPKNLYLILADQNPEAVAGDSVKVLVDNTLIGTYSVDKRKSAGLLSSIRAVVPQADAARLLNLLKVGETVQFGSDQATYSASLDGMTDALGDVQSCLVEAQALGTSD